MSAPIGDGIGHQPIQSGRRQPGRQRTEEPGEAGEQLFAADCTFDVLPAPAQSGIFVSRIRRGSTVFREYVCDICLGQILRRLAARRQTDSQVEIGSSSGSAMMDFGNNPGSASVADQPRHQRGDDSG
jgi:hypothetical protein